MDPKVHLHEILLTPVILRNSSDTILRWRNVVGTISYVNRQIFQINVLLQKILFERMFY